MNSGSQWEAWGPRLVSATLDCGEHFHVLACYAPTFAAEEDGHVHVACEQVRYLRTTHVTLLISPETEVFLTN